MKPLTASIAVWMSLAAVVPPIVGVSARDEREVTLAEDAILLSLMISQNPPSRTLCIDNEYACLSVRPAELGLALIASRETKGTPERLVALLRYRLDGELAENVDCYILNKGKRVQSALQSVNKRVLRDRCVHQVGEAIRRHRGKFDTLKVESVCAEESTISEKSIELLAAIKEGSKCAEEDF